KWGWHRANKTGPKATKLARLRGVLSDSEVPSEITERTHDHTATDGMSSLDLATVAITPWRGNTPAPHRCTGRSFAGTGPAPLRQIAFMYPGRGNIALTDLRRKGLGRRGPSWPCLCLGRCNGQRAHANQRRQRQARPFLPGWAMACARR